jgi:hypothetical protein
VLHLAINIHQLRLQERSPVNQHRVQIESGQKGILGHHLQLQESNESQREGFQEPGGTTMHIAKQRGPSAMPA